MIGVAKRWGLPSPAPTHSLPGYLSSAAVKILVHRGIDTAEKLRLFLDPPHRLPYDPLRLTGMEQALRRLYQASEAGERVGVFGDFDVDGVTGAAIVGEGLAAFGVPVSPYLPHRSEEGHGLSAAAIDRLALQGASLIVTVDCGVTSSGEVAYAKEQGVDVIITDHHLPQEDLPDAAAIVDPQLPGNFDPFRTLCGAGLAFKLVQGLYQLHGQPWPRNLLELAALGTIADLVPMVDENRYLVQEGISGLAATQRPGLQALYCRAGIQAESLNAETIAFQVTPRLNAPGRLGHALDSYRLLTTRSGAEAATLAEKLESLNRERRELTQEAMNSALSQVNREIDVKGLPALLMVSGPGITRGVAGLVAGRLCETFYRPAIALSIEGDYAVGSGRSIAEFDLFNALSTCQDLFVRFGGHAQAAGFTVESEKLALLQDRLTVVAEESLDWIDLRPVLEIDAEIGLADLSGDFPKWVSTLEPFGPSNPRPVFLTRRARVLEAREMGRDSQHLNLKVAQGDHQWTALAFNQAEHWVAGTAEVDLAYSLSKDHWQGVERSTLKVLDYRPSEV